MRKIIENGSLYGVPSAQITDDMLNEEMDEPDIQKPVNFLREGAIEGLYEQFKEEIEKLKEEETQMTEKTMDRDTSETKQLRKTLSVPGSDEESADKTKLSARSAA